MTSVIIDCFPTQPRRRYLYLHAGSVTHFRLDSDAGIRGGHSLVPMQTVRLRARKAPKTLNPSFLQVRRLDRLAVPACGCDGFIAALLIGSKSAQNGLRLSHVDSGRTATTHLNCCAIPACYRAGRQQPTPYQAQVCRDQQVQSMDQQPQFMDGDAASSANTQGAWSIPCLGMPKPEQLRVMAAWCVAPRSMAKDF